MIRIYTVGFLLRYCLMNLKANSVDSNQMAHVLVAERDVPINDCIYFRSLIVF
jgi:hypothetical protein